MVALRLRFNGLAGTIGDARQGVCRGQFGGSDDGDAGAGAEAEGDLGGSFQGSQGRSPLRSRRKSFPWTLRFPRITDLDLSGNALAGHIPSCLGKLCLLRTLNLGQNSLTGPLPLDERASPWDNDNNDDSDVDVDGHGSDGSGGFAGLAGLTRLRSLSLRQNVLTGPLTGKRLPPSLTLINFSSNRFSGVSAAAVLAVVLHGLGENVLLICNTHARLF